MLEALPLSTEGPRCCRTWVLPRQRCPPRPRPRQYVVVPAWPPARLAVVPTFAEHRRPDLIVLEAGHNSQSRNTRTCSMLRPWRRSRRKPGGVHHVRAAFSKVDKWLGGMTSTWSLRASLAGDIDESCSDLRLQWSSLQGVHADGMGHHMHSAQSMYCRVVALSSGAGYVWSQQCVARASKSVAVSVAARHWVLAC